VGLEQDFFVYLSLAGIFKKILILLAGDIRNDDSAGR